MEVGRNINKAFNAGADAHDDGVGLAHNPYKREGVSWVAWRKGWMRGFEMAKQARREFNQMNRERDHL